jgi:hypothetical protein
VAEEEELPAISSDHPDSDSDPTILEPLRNKDKDPSQRTKKMSKDDSSLVVVDWTNLSDREGVPAQGDKASEWDRIPTEVSAPPENAARKPDPPPEDAHQAEPADQHIVQGSEGFLFDKSEEPDEQLDADLDSTIRAQHFIPDTSPGSEPTDVLPERQRPFFLRPLGLAIAGVALGLLVLVIVVITMSDDKSSGREDAPAGDPGPAAEAAPAGEKAGQGDESVTPLGFLSITTDIPAKVTLDGELLPGTTPVSNKLLRAGKHRLMLDSLEGERLLDETITIEAGKHENFRVRLLPAKAGAKTSSEAKRSPSKKRRKKASRRKKRKKRARKW